MDTVKNKFNISIIDGWLFIKENTEAIPTSMTIPKEDLSDLINELEEFETSIRVAEGKTNAEDRLFSARFTDDDKVSRVVVEWMNVASSIEYLREEIEELSSNTNLKAELLDLIQTMDARISNTRTFEKFRLRDNNVEEN